MNRKQKHNRAVAQECSKRNLAVMRTTTTESGKRWKESDPHGKDCAMRFHSAAECTCGKLDYLADHEG